MFAPPAIYRFQPHAQNSKLHTQIVHANCDLSRSGPKCLSESIHLMHKYDLIKQVNLIVDVLISTCGALASSSATSLWLLSLALSRAILPA